MDYSDIHRENEVLEENLEERLGYITLNERKVLAEKGEELYEIRKQLEEITKLQTAVNSRNLTDSIDIVSNAKAMRYGRDDSAFLTTASRARMKVEAEREKFSAKNVFNIRSLNSSGRLEFVTSSKILSTAQVILGEEAQCSEEVENMNRKLSDNSPIAKLRSKHSGEVILTQLKSRPVTAREDTARGRKVSNLIPRSKSAVPRSRSRRQLELLSRILPEEQDVETNLDFKVKWNIIKERARNHELQQLRLERQLLQGRVHSFLQDLKQFNRQATWQKTPQIKLPGHKQAMGIEADLSYYRHTLPPTEMKNEPRSFPGPNADIKPVDSSTRSSNARV